MGWKVQLSDQAVKALKKLDRVNREMIVAYLEQRIDGCSNPRLYGKPLKKDSDTVWRYTVGQYRLICELDNMIITVYVHGGILMNLIKTIQDWAYSLAISLALALFINIFIAQHIVVEGHSMDPTLQNHQHLVVSKLSHSIKQIPDYGDIVIIDSRVNRERSLKDDLAEPVNKFISQQDYVFIKRVIGKPGDVLEFNHGNVVRNGIKLDETYILEPMKYPLDRKVVVPNNSVFVMGDNRNNSMDSRIIGNIPLDHVLGKVFIKL
ncbi:MAG: sipT 1 [Firmicutes bacterium]|nr:sipT 1 [Bacillota bacterium]